MRSALLIGLTLVVPGVWGWMVSAALTRLWPPGEDRTAGPTGRVRSIDFQI